MARLKGKPFMFRSGGSLWRLETSAAGSVLNPCWQPFPFSNTSARWKQTQCPVEADDVKQNLQILQYLNFGSCRRAQCLKKGAHLCKCDFEYILCMSSMIYICHSGVCTLINMYIIRGASPVRGLLFVMSISPCSRLQASPIPRRTWNISHVQTLQKLWPL